MFCIYVHIYTFHLHLTLNLILSLRSNQVHTFHCTFPSSPPTLFLDGFAPHICPVHQRIVFRWAESFVVPGSLGCAEGSEPEFASCFGSGQNSSGVYLVFECFCWFAELLWYSLSQSSSAFLQMGQFGPHPHLAGFGTAVLGGWLILWLDLDLILGGGWSSIFIGSLGFVEVMVLLGRIDQSFLSSKRLPDTFPASVQGVLVQMGAFSNGGGFLWCWRVQTFRNYWCLSICLGWLHGCTAGIQPGYYLYFVFLGGNKPFSFFHCFGFFPFMGIGVGLRGSKLIGLWLGFWSQLSPLAWGRSSFS